ncbi:MAG: hypothetical protein IPK97_16845 [Ahniella sp.]|nr:hypothetical protein [Ahniella sp.]
MTHTSTIDARRLRDQEIERNARADQAQRRRGFVSAQEQELCRHIDKGRRFGDRT